MKPCLLLRVHHHDCFMWGNRPIVVQMLRNIAFCAACLAVRGLAPGDCFTFPFQSVLRAGRSRCKNGNFHEYARSDHQHATQGLPLLRARIVPYDSTPRTDYRHREEGVAFDDPDGVEEVVIDSVESTAAETAAATTIAVAGLADECELQQPESLAASFVTSTKTLLSSAVVGCSIMLAAASALPHPACASGAAASAETQTTTSVSSTPRPSTRKARPPPPEIPPGRITIVQWCARERDRHLPSERDLQTVVERMQGDKGPAPSAEDMRNMAVDAQRSVSGSFMGAIKGGGKGLRSTPVTSPAAVAEAPPEEAADPKSAMQEEIDALKVEMLNLQAQTAQSSGAASEAPTIYRRDTSERVTAALPSYQIGASTTKPTQNEPVTGRAGRDRPVPRKEPRKGARKATSLAVDLKAELRAESEKAAAKASKRDSGRVEKSSQGVGLQNVQEPVERTRTARSEEREGGRTMPEVPSSLSATKASAGTAVAGRQGESIPSPTATAGLDDVTAAGRALLAGTTFQRAADQLQDVAGQVKDLADNGGSSSQAGVEAVLEQGRASVDRLQAEANRISAGLSDTAAPLADKLSTGVSKLPETGRKVGSGLSELSGRVTARVADSAKSAATVGATAAGGLSGALRFGSDTILPRVGEAGRVVNNGVSALSKSAVDRLPGVKDQASVMSSQIVDASSGAASRATDAISAGAGDLSDRLSDLAGRGPELSVWTKNAVARLRVLGGGFAEGATAGAQKFIATVRSVSGSSSSDAKIDGAVLAAATTVTVVGTAVVARSMGAGEVVPGGEDTGDEGELLQPIGVKKERGSESDGERYGAEAVSATGTLWDMIRESGTAAGDAVREVSEEDLLARATEVGDELRDTSEGLEVLKEEVMALRESIRESDLEGKADALREALASALEGSVVE